MSFSRKFERTLPVSLKLLAGRPAAPQKAECCWEPLPFVSSFFLLTLTSTPAFTKCLPNTRV